MVELNWAKTEEMLVWYLHGLEEIGSKPEEMLLW
jgi:hypothetical protein